ncbi:MAG: hypothetical protein AAFV98_00840 [Chloroflexota bacterium]
MMLKQDYTFSECEVEIAMISEKDALLIAEKSIEDGQEDLRKAMEARGRGYRFFKIEWKLSRTYHDDDEWYFEFRVGENTDGSVDPSVETVSVHKETGEVRHR